MIKKVIITFLATFLKTFNKEEKKIVYHSFPDFSDNSFAVFIYISNNFTNYLNIWLVDDYSEINKYEKLVSNYTQNLSYKIVKKKSPLGLFHYLTSNIIFYTHGIFDFIGLIPGQKKTNLWHGMPIKNIGLLNGTKVPVSDYYVVTSAFYQDIISGAFGVDKNKVLIGGQTRNDFLVDSDISINKLFDNKIIYKQTILWMPTYRKSTIPGMKGIDGNINPSLDFLCSDSLIKVNEILIKTESFCFIKIHPMDVMKVSDFNNYSNIKIVDNSDFDRKGVTMHSIFNSIDVLLTDFSSIYIDFLLLNKPIGFVFSDYDEFKNSRGFIFSEPKKYMPGEIITCLDKLENFLIKTILNDIDDFTEHREKVKTLFHEFDKDFSKTIAEKILNE
ncbi:CDP-glycerol glycerophosphotransferase family protein [Winogradskyella flava]|uniref:CDP-glycerol glycerophosphotransferase family protein n=1 Tax=Winogradskyella flava TaxID=1884876 RepID=A0A842IQV9_9FLAO|nr:CDP-glycerol glycerophosphotransferase family protein [Winogradskyella flava]MBC2843857.1 CDP-glycerol glycerophosphotransferase family protein [Winogradskyella flava]